MNRTQYKIIKKIISYNTPDYYNLTAIINGEKSVVEGPYKVKYDKKYGKLLDFKTIRGYKVDSNKGGLLFIDYALLEEYQEYIDKRIDFYFYKLITILLSLLAIVLSIISLLK